MLYSGCKGITGCCRRDSEWCVGFNIPLNRQQVISETSLPRQSIARILTTKQQQRANRQNIKKLTLTHVNWSK